MTVWFVLALMTVAAVLAVLWPLGRRARARRSGSDLAVYRDQIEEISRDRASGLIGEAEAEAARVELSRRLIAAADAAGSVEARPGDLPRRRIAVVVALILLPGTAVALYVKLGSPALPAQPLAARIEQPSRDQSIANLIAQVEAHLERNPEEGRGWEVLAPVYMRLARFDEAVKARRNALRLLGATADREADLGEALTAAGNGVVSAEAKEAFERATGLDTKHPKARFFLGLAAEQDGKREAAAAIWRSLLQDSPPEAPWAGVLRESLARVEAPKAPTAEEIAAAERMSADERAKMVRAMVDGLAARLKQDGSDVEGWLRLLRAYMVLGEPGKARDAATEARRALGSEQEKVRRLDALIKELGLEG